MRMESRAGGKLAGKLPGIRRVLKLRRRAEKSPACSLKVLKPAGQESDYNIQ
jgi:hypothetical protein